MLFLVTSWCIMSYIVQNKPMLKFDNKNYQKLEVGGRRQPQFGLVRYLWLTLYKMSKNLAFQGQN